ncbi:hypothetical protein QBC39DRAFT_270039 [Podospora conica]|nr:hypothetical protein QBC39DRAFT_270039 [Schizothecium conicum]
MATSTWTIETLAAASVLRPELREFRGEVRAGFQKLQTTTSNLESAMADMDARNRNNNLHNPTLPFRPIPTTRPGATRGIMYPSTEHFPQNANDFYALRKPSTESQRRTLAYLAKFYDISIQAKWPSTDSEPAEPRQQAGMDPGRIVDLLGDIFGLREDNFIAFRERSRHFNAQPPRTAEKRSEAFSDRQVQRRPRIDSPEDSPPRPITPLMPLSNSPTNLNTPTPPGGRPPKLAFPARPAAAANTRPRPPPRSAHTSATNPFTPPNLPQPNPSIPDTESQATPPNLPRPNPSIPDTESQAAPSSPQTTSGSGIPDTEPQAPPSSP